MENTVNLRRDEVATISRLLLSAMVIIKKMDGDLTGMGRGRNLSSVDGWEGQDFGDTLKVYAENLNFLAHKE